MNNIKECLEFFDDMVDDDYEIIDLINDGEWDDVEAITGFDKATIEAAIAISFAIEGNLSLLKKFPNVFSPNVSVTRI